MGHPPKDAKYWLVSPGDQGHRQPEKQIDKDRTA